MDISAFSRQHLGFDSLLRKCHKIEILVDLLTGDLKEQKTMKERKIHQGCSLFFYATDSAEMGNALFAVGWDCVFADNFHSFEFRTSK